MRIEYVTPYLRPETSDSDASALPRLLEHLVVRLLFAATHDLIEGAWNHRFLHNDVWRLYQNDSDGGLLQLTDAVFPLQANCVYLIPPGLSLASRNESHLRQFYIHFDIAGLPPIVLQEMTPGPVELPYTPLFTERVAAMGTRVQQEGCQAFDLRCQLMSIIYDALGLYAHMLPKDLRDLGERRMFLIRPLFPALHHIQSHLHTRITNHDLAELCSMSEDYFIRRFREAVGLPPSKYVLKSRVAVAAQKLRFTSDSIEAIADASGFGDRFYFTRVFAQHTGSPPAAYRRAPSEEKL